MKCLFRSSLKPIIAMPWGFLFFMLTILLTVILPVFTFVTINNKRKDRLTQQSSDANSLTTSELEHLIQKAVAQATAPLEARLKSVEHIQLKAGTPSLLEPSTEFADESMESVSSTKTIGRTH